MKWSKRDIKTLCGALSTFWLVNRPLSGSTAEAVTRVRTYLNGPMRVEVICAGLKDLIDLNQDRATSAQKTSYHYASHPSVMGKGTPEIVARFAELAISYERDAQKGLALIGKIREYGLPPEVLQFDPT
jgi:hypothetical protein